MRADSWQEDALCSQIGPEFFFPEPGDTQTIVYAKRVCRMCSVRLDCLRFALLDPDITHGIWGGHSISYVKKPNQGKHAA